MRTLTVAAALVCLCAWKVHAGEGQALADLEKFQAVMSDNNRALRAVHDARSLQSAPAQSNKRVSQYHTTRDGVAPQGTRSPSNIVYGKGRHAEQPKHTRQQYSAASQSQGQSQTQRPKQHTQQTKHKFAPSQEDSGYESDAGSQYAQNYKLIPQDSEVLQKYMQKYANQLYAAQKHASQLSESQKHVLGQDPYAKKYVAPQTQKYQAPKFIPIQSQQEPKEPIATYSYQDPESQEAPEPITTERYQNYQVQQKLVVHNLKTTKAPPKKAYSSFDNTPQYTSLYGNSLEPQLVNQYLSAYGSQDKDSFTGYEPHQSYGQYGVGASSADKSELSKITGYKIPGAVSLSMGHGQGADDKGHYETAHEEHYPTAEPKYEYMYQVQDHEKHNHFGHSEARKGKNTWGRYYVQLPDGRFETVKYWADKSGYHAEVDFKGHAKHPSHKEQGHGHSQGGSGHGGSSYIGGNTFKGYTVKSEDAVAALEGYSTSEVGEDF